MTPSYFGPQGLSPAIDQVNLLLPPNTPKGSVDVGCHFKSTAGAEAPLFGLGNTVTISVQ